MHWKDYSTPFPVRGSHGGQNLSKSKKIKKYK